MKLGRVFFLLLGLFAAQLSWGAQEYLDIQSGSLMGMGHASIGGRFAERHNVMFGIGYVPELSYHEEMVLYSLRYRYDHSATWHIGKTRFKPFNFGVGLLMGDHKDLFLELPNQYPEGYYHPSAFRIVFNYQAKLEVTAQFSAYFDVSVLDVGMIGYIREPEFFYDNYDYLGLEGITNWGFGVRYVF